MRVGAGASRLGGAIDQAEVRLDFLLFGRIKVLLKECVLKGLISG